MLEKREIFRTIKKTQQEVMSSGLNECLRPAKTWQYNTPYKMFIMDVELAGNGFANVDTAIEVNPDAYTTDRFHFKYEGSGKNFWEKFLETVVPDQTKDVSVADLIGKAFVGQIVQNDIYDNLEALDSCEDEEGVDDPDDGFMEAGFEELPFE